MAKDGTERPGIQSAEIAAAILRALVAEGGSLPLGALAQAAGMHRAKVHRYLISLARAGLVAQDDKTGHYAIGPFAITVGLVGLRRLAPLRLAGEALPALRDRVGETVFLAIWGEMGTTVIALEESARSVTLNVRVGSVLPLLTSAAGRVAAAHLPASVTGRALRDERRRGDAARAPSAESYAAIIEEVRARGLARVRGTLIPGLDAIAAPCFDHRGALSSILGIVGYHETFDIDWTGAPARILAETAGNLSEALGHAR